MEDSFNFYLLLSLQMNYIIANKKKMAKAKKENCKKKEIRKFAKANQVKSPKSWHHNEAAGED